MEYYQRNEQALREEKASLEKQANEWGNNAEMLYIQPGTTMIRVLPSYSSAGVFFHKITKHNINMDQRNETFICPVMVNLPCAICVKGQELTNSRDEKKMEFARDQLRPRNRYLYNVLCYSGPADKLGVTPEFGKIYVMEIGVMVHRQIIGLDQDGATGWADITNLETGVNLIIKRTGKGQYDTKYEVHPHGGGRTNIFADCQARGIDPNSLKLFNLEQVYTSPPDWKLEELANSIDRLVGGNFGAVNMPRPVLQTVSPVVAGGVPTLPTAETPVPAVAPISPPQTQPQSPQKAVFPPGPHQVSAPPQTAPSGPIMTPNTPQPGLNTETFQSSPVSAPQVPPPTGRVAPATTSGFPQAPVIPPPPCNDEEIPF